MGDEIYYMKHGQYVMSMIAEGWRVVEDYYVISICLKNDFNGYYC